MPSILRLVCNIVLNLGELVELLLVFLELLDQEHTDQDKLLSVTCVERVVCSLPSRCGEDGIDVSTSNKRDMPLLQLLQPQA